MKTVLLCFVALAVSYTCCAYDFSDPEFNGIIEEELYEDAQLGKHNSRVRRDIDEEEEERSASTSFEQDDADQDVNEDRPNSHGSHCRKHQKGCCGGKTPISISFLPHNKNQTMRSAGSECFEEVNFKLGNKTYEDDMNPYNCEKVKRMKKRHVCIHECKARKQEVANEAGTLDFAQVKVMLSSRLNETWQKDLIEKAVDDCSRIAYDETWKVDTDEYKCNPQALQFKHCVWKQVESKCPEEHQNTGKILPMCTKEQMERLRGKSFACRHCKKMRSKLAVDKSVSDNAPGQNNTP